MMTASRTEARVDFDATVQRRRKNREELPFVKPAPIRGVHPQQAERRSA
jgi:hypothetical protein